MDAIEQRIDKDSGFEFFPESCEGAGKISESFY